MHKPQPWKVLLKQGVLRSRSWLDLNPHQILTSMEIQALRKHCITAFLEPDLPLPVLRREAKGFETVVQEYLAYGLEPGFPDDPDVESAFDTIDSYSDQLLQQFESKSDLIALLKARWSLPSHTLESALALETASSSLVSSAGSDCPHPIPPFVLQFLRAIRCNAKFQCEYHLRELQDARNCGELLSEYVRRVNSTQWAAYSAAAKTLAGTHCRFEALFNELYEALVKEGKQEPQFGVVRMMAVAWRRKVFEPLQEQLMSAALELLQQVRDDVLKKTTQCNRRRKSLVVDDPRLGLLASIHYIDHSLLLPPGPYAQLHELVVRSSKAHLDGKKFDLQTAPVVLTADLKMLERAFLPCTAQEVAGIYGELELGLWKEMFLQRYEGQWPKVSTRLREDVAEMHINSAFGYFLFQADPNPDAKANIRKFIEFLLSEDTANLSRINRFNELAGEDGGEKKLTLDDEELEFRMKANGLDLEKVQRCEMWQSMHRDVDIEGCEELLRALPKDLLY